MCRYNQRKQWKNQNEFFHGLFSICNVIDRASDDLCCRVWHGLSCEHGIECIPQIMLSHDVAFLTEVFDLVVDAPMVENFSAARKHRDFRSRCRAGETRKNLTFVDEDREREAELFGM